jgi:mRNA interferase MazF
MGVVVVRFDVFLVVLDPNIGSEFQKRLAPVGFPEAKSETRQIRPCVVISPDEMNLHLATVIIAPMTTKRKAYPSRVPVNFQEKAGFVVLDQIRTVDKISLVQKIGTINNDDKKAVLAVLSEMFAEE